MNRSFSGFTLCARRLSIAAGGMALSGAMAPSIGIRTGPLTATSRQVRRGRTVGYGLSSGRVLSIPELVTLIGSGVTVEGVHVVHGRTGTWVRSDPDATRRNNLAELPVTG